MGEEGEANHPLNFILLALCQQLQNIWMNLVLARARPAVVVLLIPQPIILLLTQHHTVFRLGARRITDLLPLHLLRHTLPRPLLLPLNSLALLIPIACLRHHFDIDLILGTQTVR